MKFNTTNTTTTGEFAVSPFCSHANSTSISFLHLDTINNGSNNNNTYIGNFRVQHNDNSTSPNQQMMSQMTDGFKPFYKKYAMGRVYCA